MAAVSVSVESLVAAESSALRQGPRRLVPGDHGVGQRIADFTVSDIDGNELSLADFGDRSALVVAFTNTSCPLCKKYTPTLAALEDRYSGKNVAFLFVNPTSSDELQAIRSVMSSNQLDGRYVRDEDEQLVRAFGATHTTDVFVLDAQRTVIYRGAVDDQYGFGYSLDEPRSHYLVSALDAMLAGERVRISATEAPGCPIDVADTDGQPSELTYHNHVSRILQNHCVGCHREGGVAPFSLDDYDAVVSQSGAIRRVVEDDIMPPWFAAKPDAGEVSPFINDCSLSHSDKEKVLAWLSGDKTEGDPADAPLPRAYSSDWQIGEPDVVLQLPEPIAVKASGTMPYQYATIETGFTEDRFIKAIEIRPTAREVVHHCLVTVLPPPDAKVTSRGQRGFGEDRDGFFAAYAPGYEALHFNDGFGKMIPAGSRLRFQLHYTPNGTATADQSMIGMVFADKPPKQIVNVAGIAQPRLAIPPHAENHEVSAETRLPRDATILAFFPHMHLRGKAFRFDAITPDGKTQRLLDVPRYDFNWQLSYRLAEPLRLPAGSTIRATGWFDNSANNPANPDPDRTVRWGEQTYDEMMIGYVEYHMEADSANRGDDSALGALLGNLNSRKAIEAKFEQLDKNHDERLSGDELPHAQKAKLLRLDQDGDGEISWKEAERLVKLVERRR
ncbi:MAG: redoxin family protein [Planctomycetaceae bacterium]